MQLKDARFEGGAIVVPSWLSAVVRLNLLVAFAVLLASVIVPVLTSHDSPQMRPICPAASRPDLEALLREPWRLPGPDSHWLSRAFARLRHDRSFAIKRPSMLNARGF